MHEMERSSYLDDENDRLRIELANVREELATANTDVDDLLEQKRIFCQESLRMHMRSRTSV